MNKQTTKPLIAAIGTTFAITMAASAPVQAESNPFAMTDLGSGYQVAAAKDGACGEAKCGASPAAKRTQTVIADKSSDGQCGASKATPKAQDGQCGADKEEKAMPAKTQDGQCGASTPKVQESKCGSNG